MKNHALYALVAALISVPAFAAPDCQLLTFNANSSQRTPLTVKSNDPLVTVLTASSGATTVLVNVFKMPGDSGNSTVSNVTAAIYVNGAYVAGIGSESLKTGQSFYVDGPGSRLICTL